MISLGKHYISSEEIFDATISVNGTHYMFEIYKTAVFDDGKSVEPHARKARRIWEVARAYDLNGDCHVIASCGECDRRANETANVMSESLARYVPK